MMKLRSTVLSFLLSLTVVATACAPATPAPAAPAPGPAAPVLADDQRFTIGASSIPSTLDPAVNIAGTVRRFEIFETLVILKEDGSGVEPMLATDWRSVDATTWRFTLRRDSRFHDGTQLTANDVVYSWNRLKNPALRSPIPGYFPSIVDITAPDLSTIEVTTRTPDPVLVKRISMLAIVPRAYVERVGDQEFSNKPIGSGPFRLKEFRSEDRLVLSRWDEHPWRKPKLTEIVVRMIPDGTARFTGLRTGELDYASGLSIEHAELLRREGMGLDLQGPAVAGALLDTWGVDGTNVGPIADRRVRQAINYAIDRETLAKTIYRGLSEPAGYLIPAGINGHDPNLKPYTYDPARARQLLAQAGYPNGFTIDMEFIIASPETQPTVLYLQSQLKAVGIEVNLLPIEIGVFREKIYKLRPIAPMYFGGLGAGPFVDGDWLLTWFWSDNKQFGKRFNNPEFDRVYVQSVQEMDPQRREALMRQAAAILQEDPGWLGVVTTYGVSGYAKNLQGLKVRPDGIPFADTIYRVK